jgi:cell division protein FtsW
VERIGKERGDFVLLLLMVLLAGVGMSLLFSASYSFSQRSYHDPFYLLKRQLLFLGAGAGLALLFSFIPLEFLRRRMPLILLVTLAVAFLPFVPGLGVEVLGSRRWIQLFGFSFQPSELMKLTLIAYISSYFAKQGRGRTLNELIPPFIVIVVFAGIVYLQNDYSTSVFMFIIGLSMLFICRVKALHFALLAAFAFPVSFFLLFTREQRVRRLLAFLGLAGNGSASSYQVVNSQSAFVAGGLWGKGLGGSVAKTGPLPMSHSDFIFAVIGEETGFFGTLFVILLFAALAWRGYRIALEAEEGFHRYLAFGITTTIVVQALLNMTVTVGLVPTTGVTLPFFSAGGSSLAVTLAMCGLLANVARRNARSARGEMIRVLSPEEGNADV